MTPQNHTPARPRRLAPRRPFSASRWLAEDRPITPRLPDDRTARDEVLAVLADVVERPGRPVPQALALHVYQEVEYLTRTTGVLAVTMATLADRVNASIARREAARPTAPGCRRAARIGKATHGKVAAVVRRLAAAGWLTEERKTMRQTVFVVAELRRHEAGSAEAIEHRVTTGSPIGHSVNQSETCSRPALPDPAQCVQEQEPSPAVRRAAVDLVNTWRAWLGCKRAPNPAGAWYRFLVRYLADRESDLAGARWGANEALAQLVREHGAAVLTADRFFAALPTSSGPRVWSRPPV